MPEPGDGMSFFLGIVNIALMIIGGLAFLFYLNRYSFIQKKVLIWAFILIFSSIFLMNHRLTIVWDNLPLIKYFQFPWRFLILTTFSTPLLIVVTVITSKDYFQPEHFLGITDEYYINRYIPAPVGSSEYYSTQEEYLRIPKKHLNASG